MGMTYQEVQALVDSTDFNHYPSDTIGPTLTFLSLHIEDSGARRVRDFDRIAFGTNNSITFDGVWIELYRGKVFRIALTFPDIPEKSIYGVHLCVKRATEFTTNLYGPPSEIQQVWSKLLDSAKYHKVMPTVASWLIKPDSMIPTAGVSAEIYFFYTSNPKYQVECYNVMLNFIDVPTQALVDAERDAALARREIERKNAKGPEKIPGFMDLKWESSPDLAKRVMLKRKGVRLDEESSDPTMLVFYGGEFGGSSVSITRLYFSKRGLCGGRIVFDRVSESELFAQYDDLKRLVVEKYGPLSNNADGRWWKEPGELLKSVEKGTGKIASSWIFPSVRYDELWIEIEIDKDLIVVVDYQNAYLTGQWADYEREVKAQKAAEKRAKTPNEF